MAGNLPLVGFFDLLCVVASGHRCLVKPSSKDRVLIGYAIDELKRIDPATLFKFARSAVKFYQRILKKILTNCLRKNRLKKLWKLLPIW